MLDLDKVIKFSFDKLPSIVSQKPTKFPTKLKPIPRPPFTSSMQGGNPKINRGLIYTYNQPKKVNHGLFGAA